MIEPAKALSRLVHPDPAGGPRAEPMIRNRHPTRNMSTLANAMDVLKLIA